MVKNTQRGDHSLHHSCQCQLWEIAGIPPGCAAILGYSGFPPSVVWYFCFEVSGPGLPGRWRCDVRCHETSVPNNESRVNTQKIDDFKVKDELTVLECRVDCPVYGLSVHDCQLLMSNDSGVPKAGGVQPFPPKFRRPSKIVANSTRLWKLLKIDEFRTPKPQDVWKKRQ